VGMIPVEQTVAIIEATKNEPRLGHYVWLLLIAMIGIIPAMIKLLWKGKK